MTHPFPVIASILSPQALAEKILPGYGIDDVVDARFYSGGFNDTYRFQTAGGATCYLRAYLPAWRTLPDILYELDVLNHLQAKGLPAARPLPYRDGHYHCAVPALEGERFIAVFAEAPGQEISYEVEPAAAARGYGHAVAAMHNALDDFASRHQRFHKDLAHFVDMPLRHVGPFLSHRPADWTYFQQLAQSVRQRILALPATALEQGVCHGDLQGYHAKVDAAGTLTFYDFDCGGYGYRAYDLAVFLWCCRLEDAPDRWPPFLQAYREARAIADLDVAAIPLFVCARYLWHMGVHTQNSPDWGIGFLDDAYFDTHLKRLRQAEADFLD